MRPSTLLVAATLALSAQASWFSGNNDNSPEYSSWNNNQLKAWLQVHNVPIPDQHTPTKAELQALVEENWNTASTWTRDQYDSAQKAFADLRDTAFDTWDESRLREFLLQHGIVAPSGPREHLVLLAQQRYRAYTNAASSLSSRVSATASTAVYGDTQHQMTKSASSVVSKATDAASDAGSHLYNTVASTAEDIGEKFDATKHYVYSNWSEDEMRKYLESKGVIKTKTQKTKDELLNMMHKAYGAVADPIWEAWSDSYIHNWLLSRHLIKSDFEKRRDALVKPMQKYYYSATEYVWSPWTDSELKAWLVKHGIIKSDAQVSRDKMLTMMKDNYVSSKDAFWSAWTDNSIRDWLIENGYMRSDAQYKRDQLVALANEKWTDQKEKTAAYIVWPDARLRAYLRERGISEAALPTGRPGLLQETRIRWIQSQRRSETLFEKIKELVNSGLYKADDVISRIMSLLKGDLDGVLHHTNAAYETAKDKTQEGYYDAKHKGEAGWNDAKGKAEQGWNDAKASGASAGNWAAEKVGETVEAAGEKVKAGGDKVKATGQKLQGEL